MGAVEFSDCADQPIPVDIGVGKGWPPSMIEMADHIGAYAVLLISEHLGGQAARVAKDPTRGPFAKLIGPDKSATLSEVYGGERLLIPVAKYPLSQARRAGVIRRIRAGELTIADGVRILRTSRGYLSALVDNPEEGQLGGAVPARLHRDPRQIELFDE